MASKSICFWASVIFFSVQSGSSVQSNGLQQVEKGIDVSATSTSPSTDEHIDYALYYESDGNRKENDSSKIYVEISNSTSYQPLSSSDQREQEFAILRAHPGRYSSAKATISVHPAFYTDINQQSSAAVWVMNLADGPPRKSNIISAGWHVHPKLHGDKETYFFVSWSVVDGKSTKGCYNLQCEGFVVHKNTTYYPGILLKPLSIYNGEQWYITLKITKDSQTGDWWLYHGPNGDEPVGYWPKTLFTSLADSATNVDFGGAVAFDRGERGPPMGSGAFPSEGEKRAASLTNLEINNTPFDAHDQIFYTHQSMPQWYQIGGDKKIYFGGTGGHTTD